MAVAVATTQPVVSDGWVRAPVEGLRVNTATALPMNAATYTLSPLGLTAMPSGPPSARPVTQPVLAALAMQPLLGSERRSIDCDGS